MKRNRQARTDLRRWTFTQAVLILAAASACSDNHGTSATTTASSGGSAGTVANTATGGASGTSTTSAMNSGGVGGLAGSPVGGAGQGGIGGTTLSSTDLGHADGSLDVDAAKTDAVTNGGSEAGGTAPTWCLPLSKHPMGIDWAKALIDGRLKGGGGGLGWAYPDGLFLHGVYMAYKRLGDPKYLAYIKTWADGHTGGAGGYGSLDSMQPTLVLVDMYRETKDAKYGTAPAAVAARLEGNYPKTSDGGFWHSTGLNGQLWGDGVFMDLPPYVNYGAEFSDAKAIDIATQQLIVYDKHLAAPNDLHVHQWSEVSGKQSCCEWCRAEGWYEMALLMVLDLTPPTHPNRAALLAIVQRLAKGLQATQDPATGRWWQVMDKPDAAGNWLETSCTAMHTYFLSKASEKGYIDAAVYGPLALLGFKGEMQQVSNPNDVQIANICPGTNVGDTPGFYYARPKVTNDNHGVGAFLIMYDQMVCR